MSIVAGEDDAVRLGERLAGKIFAAVLTSPLQRAVRTCELPGYRHLSVVDPDLVEWDYGRYDGRTIAEIQVERPGWDLPERAGI